MEHLFMRLQYLILNTTPKFLREKFRSLWEAQGFQSWENSPEFGTQFIQGIGKAVYDKSQKIQKQHLEGGNIELWDIPVLVKVIKVLTSKHNGPLDQLRDIRNYLAHKGNPALEESEFQEKWKDATNALLSMGMTEEEIAEAEKKLQSVPDESIRTKKILKEYKELKDLANQQFRAENYLDCITTYTEAIHLKGLPNEELGVLYSNRSLANLKLCLFDDAKEDAKSCMTLRPSWFKGYARVAKVYEMIQKYDKALWYYEISTNLEPSNEEVKDERDAMRHDVAKLKREEHMDPMKIGFAQEDVARKLKRMGYEDFGLPQPQLNKMFLQGLPSAICAEAHKYHHGSGGYPLDLEKAAQLFAEASGKGSAEGLYNLAVMTREGKGVSRNIRLGHQMLLQVADMSPSIEIVPGSGLKIINLGVAEAMHAIGLAYQNGVGVEYNLDKAIHWYKRAIANGENGFSANNLGLIYQMLEPQTAIWYWKLGSYKVGVRAMESLALHYLRCGPFKLAQEWYMFSVWNDSVYIKSFREDFKVTDDQQSKFDPDAFKMGLEKELLASPLRDAAIPKDYEQNMLKMMNRSAMKNTMGRQDTIRQFRTDLRETRTIMKKGALWEAGAGKIVPKVNVDLIGLKAITFKEMDKTTEDKVYDGFVINLTVIEDIIVKNPPAAIVLLVQDEDGTVQRLFIYNYSNLKNVQEEIGYGTNMSLVNPYFRKFKDGMFGLRVDDPNLVMKRCQLSDSKRCRYCFGKREDGKNNLPCRKCRRVYYCSKECMKKDAEELQHESICFKKL